jgi:hypothetical protein
MMQPIIGVDSPWLIMATVRIFLFCSCIKVHSTAIIFLTLSTVFSKLSEISNSLL